MDATILRGTMLFRGMEEGEIGEALRLLSAGERSFSKGAGILHAGVPTTYMGVVLEGSVTVESNDMWGNRAIFSHVGAGQFFAESYALLPDEPMLVDVVANEDCRVLFLRTQDMSRLETSWAGKLLTNLLQISARKNLHLSGRSFHTAPKTIRGRVMAYLNTVSLQCGKREFDIPFDRQQLADYLNVERTALSKELGRMQREGYLSARKNHFVLMRSE